MTDGVGGTPIAISHGNNLRDLFPGWYPPTEDERRDAYRNALVSLDANAILDLYRFTERARGEFFNVLEIMRPRLFITNQAALEFYRNRLSVVDERLRAADEKCQEIEQPLKSIVEKVREFANRHQIDGAELQRLTGLVDSLGSTLMDSIKIAGAYDLSKEDVKAAVDSVLKRLELLLTGRVGDAFSDSEKSLALKEAARRKDQRIPPGFADIKKLAPELQGGDYFLWRQLIEEARSHSGPVLFVTNEAKEDWVLKGSSNQILGPRPELVLEMQTEAGSAFHMTTVVGLLKEAPQYLDTAVSASTIREAESLPRKTRQVDLNFRRKAAQDYDQLSEAQQEEFRSRLLPVFRALGREQDPESLPSGTVKRKEDGTYLLRWSNDRRAAFRIAYDPQGEYDVLITLVEIDHKKSAEEPVDIE